MPELQRFQIFKIQVVWGGFVEGTQVEDVDAREVDAELPMGDATWTDPELFCNFALREPGPPPVFS